MKEQAIEIHEGTQAFENETMIAVMSNPQQNKTMIGSYVIIPKSQASSPFELSEKEWQDTKQLLATLKKYIDETYHPDGYNIGMNCGEPAGQSVMHVHVHLIPRYIGDVENPRGGVRGVIPSKKDY